MKINIKNNLSLRHYVVAFTTDSLSRFLIKERVYEQFIFNTVYYILTEYNARYSPSFNYKHIIRIYSDAIKDEDMKISSIGEAFVWNRTIEGYKFWNRLNDRYALSKNNY